MAENTSPEQDQEKNAFEKFVDHQKKAYEEAGQAMDALIPPDFKKHSKAALKESVEGFRVLFNTVIDIISDELDRDDSTETDSDDKNGNGGKKIKIEVN